MGNIATTVDEQLEKLKGRGIIVEDEEKAKEVLLDIGYFRLGFYLFPFEQSYPALQNRNHKYKPGTKFSDGYYLYYFDFDLRNIFLRYLSRIEVAFRTSLTYHISNKYKNSPCWFVDPSIVKSDYIAKFPTKVYTNNFKRNEAIKGHHLKYPGDIYAPAWKTIEYMTFGDVITLYESLLDLNDRLVISRQFGVCQTSTFDNYLQTLRVIRNCCAHGGQLFRISLSKSAKQGPAGHFTDRQKSHLYAGIKIMQYFLSLISVNREQEMTNQIASAYNDLGAKAPHLLPVVYQTSEYRPKLCL